MSDLKAPTPLREVMTAKPAGPAAKSAEPLPLSSSPETGGAAAEAANADQEAASAARYRRRVLLVLSAITLALVLYWASGYVFAYTDDAYVTSDFVDVAPYISGRIVSVNIVDNQTVKKGDLLATIDATPVPTGAQPKAG